MNPPFSSPFINSSETPPRDEDRAEQAQPGHGIPSQDPSAAPQFRLDPEDAKREANSALAGGRLVAGAAGAAVNAVNAVNAANAEEATQATAVQATTRHLRNDERANKLNNPDNTDNTGRVDRSLGSTD